MGLFFNWKKRAKFSKSLYKKRSRYIKDEFAIRVEKSLYKRKSRYKDKQVAIKEIFFLCIAIQSEFAASKNAEHLLKERQNNRLQIPFLRKTHKSIIMKKFFRPDVVLY
jgi:hypothetical protein